LVYTSLVWCIPLFTGYEKDAWDEEESELEMGSIKKPKAISVEREETEDEDAEVDHIGESIVQSQTLSIGEIKKDPDQVFTKNEQAT